LERKGVLKRRSAEKKGKNHALEGLKLTGDNLAPKKGYRLKNFRAVRDRDRKILRKRRGGALEIEHKRKSSNSASIREGGEESEDINVRE